MFLFLSLTHFCIKGQSCSLEISKIDLSYMKFKNFFIWVQALSISHRPASTHFYVFSLLLSNQIFYGFSLVYAQKKYIFLIRQNINFCCVKENWITKQRWKAMANKSFSICASFFKMFFFFCLIKKKIISLLLIVQSDFGQNGMEKLFPLLFSFFRFG